MKNSLTILVAVVVVAFLLAFMFTFQVRYDEVAVLTTFGSAEAPTYTIDGQIDRPGSLKNEPGLYFKAPWPIQKVEKYPRTLQVFEDDPEEIQTADGKSVIVKTYLAWRIVDPHAFFITINNTEKLRQESLAALMREVTGVISRYDFDDLVNNDPAQLELAKIEADCRDYLEEKINGLGYGIAIEQYGIRRLILPEQTTAKVFERMRATREALAENAKAEGKAHAETITTEAQSLADQILAFAERRAQALRTEGDQEAASYFDAFAVDEDFAVFLRQVQALEKMLPHNTTFILDANDLSAIRLLGNDPGAAADGAAKVSE